MRIAIVGCGYVADHYMETLHAHRNLTLRGVTDRERDRAERIARHYDVHLFESTEALLADPEVDLVVNLTDPDSHYAITKASLLAGKHVYSEKPLATELAQARELIKLAERTGLLVSAAPCSVLSETAQTLWKAIRDGAVGKVRLVYAELDDNPIYLMRPESWTNELGTPWPYLREYEVGCTLEHAGYYLTWLAAMFGPAQTLTAFSSCIVPDKTVLPLDPPDAPDFSVACIVFRSGVVARLTCSIVAPYDHGLTIIGDQGTLRVDECWHFGAPVYLERFSQLSLNARKFRSIRTSSALRSLLGVGGSRQTLVAKPQRQWRLRLRELARRERSPLRTAIKALSKRQLVAMDFFRGVAEMAEAIEDDRPCLVPPDFVLHVNELTLAIRDAAKTTQPYQVTTSFEPLSPRLSTLESERHYGTRSGSGGSSRMDRLIERLHRH